MWKMEGISHSTVRIVQEIREEDSRENVRKRRNKIRDGLLIEREEEVFGVWIQDT